MKDDSGWPFLETPINGFSMLLFRKMHCGLLNKTGNCLKITRSLHNSQCFK